MRAKMGAAWGKLSPRQKSWTMAATVALISATAGYGLSQLGEGGSQTNGDGGSSSAECEDVLYWYDPMVPGQRFDEPGKSPFMDMELVPKCAGEEATSGVQIDAGLVQNFGIRTADAEYGVLEPEVSVTGILAYNGRDVAIVQPRAGGFVQRTYGRAPDDVVSRGAPLADILVPEWGGAQQEYLAVLNSGDEQLAQAMRERMRLLGMSNGQISSVSRTGRAQATITVTAPTGGAITMLGVRPGMTVMAGQTLAEITGFSPIWLEASVPETQAANIRVGQPVSATLTAFPDERFSGPIIAIDLAECTGREPDNHRPRAIAQSVRTAQARHVRAGLADPRHPARPAGAVRSGDPDRAPHDRDDQTGRGRVHACRSPDRS
jgi:membrane fusion protein, copper/silver efflux system